MEVSSFTLFWDLILCLKDIIASTKITYTEIFALIAVLVLKLVRFEVSFINRKEKRNCYEVGYFFRNKHISRESYCENENKGESL